MSNDSREKAKEYEVLRRSKYKETLDFARDAGSGCMRLIEGLTGLTIGTAGAAALGYGGLQFLVASTGGIMSGLKTAAVLGLTFGPTALGVAGLAAGAYLLHRAGRKRGGEAINKINLYAETA